MFNMTTIKKINMSPNMKKIMYILLIFVGIILITSLYNLYIDSSKNTVANTANATITNNINSNKLTLDNLRIMIHTKLDELSKTSSDTIEKEIESMPKTDLYIKQINSYEYIKSLVETIVKTIKITNSLKQTKIPEYFPPDGNYEEHSCIKSKYNLSSFSKDDEIGSGAYGVVYKIKQDGKDYAVKVINVSDSFEYYYYDDDLNCGGNSGNSALKDIENEDEIGKILGNLGIAPKVYDTFLCRSGGQLKYYCLMDYMNQGSLSDFMIEKDLDTLHDEYINQISAKLDKMHELGYMHHDLGTKNILVNQTASGKYDFFISDFGLSNSQSQQINSEKKDLYKTLKCGSSYKMLNNKVAYITKFILSNYIV